MFKQDPPKTMRTPLDKNDHPELDDTELLTSESIQDYLTMIGQLQWLVTLGRFGIHEQVTTMSRFSSAPRKGHLERLQRIYGYVLKTKHYSTRYRTEEPDYSLSGGECRTSGHFLKTRLEDHYQSNNKGMLVQKTQNT